MRIKHTLLACALVLGLIAVGLSPAAAQDSTPVSAASGPVVPISFTEGQSILQESFDTPTAWEKYANGDVDFEVKNGAYSMHIPKSLPNSFIWGVGSTTQPDVVMQATFTQKADNTSSQFGLMCRADSNGLGYYFIVTGAGAGFIAKGVGTSIENLTSTNASSAIKAGAASNTIRAVCISDYLALYVNDELVAEANDNQYASGVAGFAALAGSDADADVTADDLTISQAVVDASPTAVPTQTTDDSTDVPVTQTAFERGNLLLHTAFTSDADWPSYTYSDGSKLGVSSGAYNIYIPKTEANSYHWQLNTEDYTDTVIDANINLVDDNPDGIYGVICRADADKGGGYYFAVTGNGLGYIAKDTGQNITDITAEVTTDAINLGSQSNKVTAVCIGDYLALYVNDQLVIDANDSDFTHGAVGLVGLSGENQDTNIEFHSLDINEAVAAGSGPVATQASAQQPDGAPVIDGVTITQNLLTETFDDPDAWEDYTSSDGAAHLRVDGGVYRASLNSDQYYEYGQNTSIETNTVIQVDAALDRGPANNWMGVICRGSTDNDGSGYYFLITSLGEYAIERYNKDEKKVEPLVDWAKSPVIKTGRATNTIAAVCVDDYLALYVNGTKLAETNDSTYTDGVTGLAVSEHDKGVFEAHFDNLSIWDAKKS